MNRLFIGTAGDGLVYFRLHGSPRMYWSKYTGGDIAALRQRIADTAAGTDVWCVFDNTAVGAAFENARELGGLFGA